MAATKPSLQRQGERQVIDTKEFHQRASRLETQLQAKLGLRGKSMSARLRRAGRLLPRRLRADVAVLTEAETKLAHPVLARQVDFPRVTKAFNAIEAYLTKIDPKDRRKGKILGWAGALVFNLLVLAVILALILRWQGLI